MCSTTKSCFIMQAVILQHITSQSTKFKVRLCAAAGRAAKSSLGFDRLQGLQANLVIACWCRALRTSCLQGNCIWTSITGNDLSSLVFRAICHEPHKRPSQATKLWAKRRTEKRVRRVAKAGHQKLLHEEHCMAAIVGMSR